MTTLTKATIARRLHEQFGFSIPEANDVTNQFFETIRHALENGQSVKLSGFGNFDLRDKKERPGRNPKTGEDVTITARRVVTFKVGQKLRAGVEELSPDEFK